MTAHGAARASRQQRQQQIVDHVLAKGDASVAELTELTGVSVMTVHRDIAELADRGILRKYHGGVSAQPSTVFESSSDFRLHAHTGEKDALAQAALDLVTPGMSLMLDDSTTALALAKLLPQVGPLTVVTNYRLITEELRAADDIRLIGIGGEYSRTHDSWIGLSALEMIKSFSVDLTLVSTSAMTGTMTYHQEQEIVALKRAMRLAGSVSVLLMDHSKVGRSALHRLDPVDTFDHVVLTGPVDDEPVAEMRKLTDVRVVTT
ncbi:DeoR/GlpR family DNA-binding transcription regulator [Streptomyces tubbatahanensis]|uniref:DeoR/GlpR family DNA-binding transcription regulator n=1 Tax=Streptomyces tubbatahanensis TaxID=2923272 RepID=A0ABY3XVB9_9ACTN|nr:DeoR/GlpR family DNA-binding transcription regulator [Streptomyces tubbatahanensis]UNS98342.1 DeoR/GlpR family DNA-binding transcription regulator [Streptomyces tubbatahanensis]